MNRNSSLLFVCCLLLSQDDNRADFPLPRSPSTTSGSFTSTSDVSAVWLWGVVVGGLGVKVLVFGWMRGGVGGKGKRPPAARPQYLSEKVPKNVIRQRRICRLKYKAVLVRGVETGRRS